MCDNWILYSNYSFNICANKELFAKYKPRYADDVVMSNDSRNKIIGMGIVKMKMFDRVVWILSDVRYTPNLRENLILMSRLDTLCYYFF